MQYKAPSVAETAVSLADLLPDGLAFDAKNTEGSNLNKLLTAFAEEFNRIQHDLQSFSQSYIPTEANLLTKEYYKDWLKVYNIPDECWIVPSLFEITYRYLLAKIRGMNNAYSKQDYIDLANFFGVPITIEYVDVFEIKILIDTGIQPGQWSWTFPHIWGNPFTLYDLLECLFLKAMPAYIKLDVIRINPANVWRNLNSEAWVNENGEEWVISYE